MNAPAQSPWNAPKSTLLVDDDSGPLYAGFWRRWAAAFLDALVLYLGVIVLTFTIGNAIAVNLISLAMGWLYHALMQSSSKQATLGKMAFGIKVVRTDGEGISFLRATARHFSTFLSAILLMIGYLMAAFTHRKQALHDMIAGTVVVRRDASIESVQNGSGTMKLTAGVWIFALILGPLPIVGILAAVSIPAYSDYTTRSKMTEAVLAGNAAKVSVTEFFVANDRMPGSLEEAGFKAIPSPNVTRVQGEFRGSKAVIRVYPSLSQANGGAVLFTAPATKPLAWTCSTDKIPKKYLPANCRN